jgi:hypothetical protein
MDESNTPQSQDKATKHGDESNDSSALSNLPETKSPATPYERYRAYHGPKPPWWKRLSSWQFFFEILIFIVTVRIAWIYADQLAAMVTANSINKQAADAATNAANTASAELELAQRPWIDFDFRIIGGLHQEADGITLKVNFSLKNIGHSPALDVFPEAIGFVAYKGHMDENATQEDLCKRMAAAKGFDHLIPQIFPDRPPIVQPVIVTFNQSDVDAAKPGGFFQPVVLGCIDYHSSFSDKHLQAPFIYDICWSAPPPANGCLKMTFPLKDWPVENLRFMNGINGSGKTR